MICKLIKFITFLISLNPSFLNYRETKPKQ